MVARLPCNEQAGQPESPFDNVSQVTAGSAGPINI
jgi:hypothetical protein